MDHIAFAFLLMIGGVFQTDIPSDASGQVPVAN